MKVRWCKGKMYGTPEWESSSSSSSSRRSSSSSSGSGSSSTSSSSSSSSSCGKSYKPRICIIYIYIYVLYCSQHLHGGMLSILTCTSPKDAPKRNKQTNLIERFQAPCFNSRRCSFLRV